MSKLLEFRTYQRSDAVAFRMTAGAFGGLSNMAPGFPLRVNGISVYTSEALYQACRFPHLPEIQKMIIEERSPMTAKMRSKPYRVDSRKDWDRVRVKIMRWCLRVKFAQNSFKFGQLLLSTDERPIVEESRKDDFWGAKITQDGALSGVNVLGRLLMELRKEIQDGAEIVRVEPLAIPDFLLLGEPIHEVFPLTDVEIISEPTAQKDNLDKRDQNQLSLLPTQTNSLPPAPVAQPLKHGLRPYPEYKDSCVSWLGRIPSHWSVLPNRAIFKEVKDREHPDEEMLSVTIIRGIVPQRALLSESSKKDSSRQDKSAYKLVQPGDIAYNKMRAWQGAIGVSSLRGIISPAYVVMRLREDENANYYHHLYRTPYFAKEAERWSYGITSDMWSLRPEQFKTIYSAVPPRAEQDAIVCFLNHADGRIERAIRAKRNLIALLNEQKQSIIHRAVTRGLEPDVLLKPSGVPWLGDIPRHWDLWRISRFSKVGNGSTPSRAKPAYWQGGKYPWLNSSQVNRGFIDSADQFVTKAALRECHLPRVPVGSVLVAITGQGKTRGTSALLGIEATINQHIAFIAPSLPVVVPEFLHLALISAYSTLRALSDDSGSTKGALTCEDLKKFKIALPPVTDQQRVVKEISSATQDVATAISRTGHEIALLREYRTRLIADVVTGKLDVREAASQLPATSEEAAVTVDDEEVDEEDIA